MFRHVVLLEFDESTSDQHLDEVADRLRDLTSSLDVLRSYTVGRDLGLASGNAHLVVLAEFDDIDGYLTYRDDPTHRRIIDEMILPNLRARSAAQFDDDRPAGAV